MQDWTRKMVSLRNWYANLLTKAISWLDKVKGQKQ
jgi:hypothetical protein